MLMFPPASHGSHQSKVILFFLFNKIFFQNFALLGWGWNVGGNTSISLYFFVDSQTRPEFHAFASVSDVVVSEKTSKMDNGKVGHVPRGRTCSIQLLLDIGTNTTCL
jgi:hypothetical protein